MQGIKKINSSLAALMLALLVAIGTPALPALAREAESGGGRNSGSGSGGTSLNSGSGSGSTTVKSGTSGSTSSGSGTSGTSGSTSSGPSKTGSTTTTSGRNGSDDASHVETEHGTEVESGDDSRIRLASVKNGSEVEHQSISKDDSAHPELHKRGDDIIAELEKGHKSTKTPEQRQKVCEAHKDGLVNKFQHIDGNSQAIQDRINDVLVKAQTYKTSHNLQPANFDALVASAEAAKATSTQSIAAMKTVEPSLDCNNMSVASDVATFKAATQQTRDSLKSYRTAVKAVLHSLEVEKAETEHTGGDQ